jgi:hypothetical protein
LPQSRRKARRNKQKAESELQPKRWRQFPTWVGTHFAAGYAIAAVVLGVLFLVTAIFGTVTNDDIAAAGMLQDPGGKGLVVYWRDPPAPEQLSAHLPALLVLSQTSAPKVLCNIKSAEVAPVSVRISNRFGKTMQSVLNALEWAVGLFYEIHFPTTLEATAKQVRDPNFGQRIIDLLQLDLRETETKALNNPYCSEAVTAYLKYDANALVCPATWFWRSPDPQKFLAIGISARCIAVATDTKPRLIGGDERRPSYRGAGYPSLFTATKIKLGVLHAEVEHKDGQ